MEWSRWAQGDLETIVEYIADEQPLTALRVFDRLHECGTRLSSQTLRGRRVPELQRLGVESYREIIESPWRIIYRPGKERVVVVAIFDARRDAPRVLFERLMQLC